MTCVRCIVFGRVQGVWFRETTRKQAIALGIAGSAINRADGSVEVIACGKGQAIAVFQEWLWEGSPLSRVDKVICGKLPVTPSRQGFTTG
jgi:acylphosphatase